MRSSTAGSESSPSVVLGLSSGLHDAAAALVVDGRIVAAVEEERLSRLKHDPSFPERAADTCLAIAGLQASDIGVLAFHEKPLGIVHRHIASRVQNGPAGTLSLLTSTPMLLRQQFLVGHRIDAWFRARHCATPTVHLAEHHMSHAAAAFYPSPFEEAAILCLDGVGEWATSTISEGRSQRLRIERELRYPESIGLLYSAFTAYCGFRVNGGEGELMGLAPFGSPVHADTIRERLIDLHDDGSLHMNQGYFRYTRGRRTTSPAFHRLFGGPPRPLGASPGQREADLAASIQVVTEDAILRMAEEARRLTGLKQLCMSGGVALNCVANGRVRQSGAFSDVWVQPAATDAGNAVGTALWSWHGVLGNERLPQPGDGMGGAFLGPAFSREEVRRWLREEGISHRTLEDDEERCAEVARRLQAGAVIGWFCGRMEFGPRSLGHRSILADAQSRTVQHRINSLVKERAAFRPFAPAVLADRVSDWFQTECASPYMTFAVPVHKAHRVEATTPTGAVDLADVVAAPRSVVPAVTHVDHSARVQTVDEDRNPEFARLLRAFERRTGCPILLNTSFNARDEPIVCTPAEAHATFERTGLDLLVIEDCLVEPA